MKIPRFAMLASLLFVAGCTATTPPDVLPAFNPADPIMGVRDAHHHPVFVNYRHRAPVEPRDWRRLNDELSPASRGAGS
jgi:hypothetical protein